jgi:26S proteasome regulatory subunit T1
MGKISKLIGIKESDTGLALPSQWFLQQDAMAMKEQPL